MPEIKFFETLKLLINLVLFEREAYLLYDAAINKIQTHKCKQILQTVSAQTRDHMNRVRRLYSEFSENYISLDNETLSLLSFMKDCLSKTTADPKEILEAAINIENKMFELYAELANTKKIESEMQEILGNKIQAEYLNKVTSILTTISFEEEVHSKTLTEINKNL